MSTFHLGRENAASLSPKEWEALERGDWSINCLRITVDNGHGRSYAGPGYIQQTAADRFRWSIFSATADVHIGHALDTFGTPGEWLPDSLFYSLDAVDLQGRQWQSYNIQISFEAGYIRPGAVISGELTYLTCEAEGRSERSVVHMAFRGKLSLPANDRAPDRPPLSFNEYRTQSLMRTFFTRNGRELNVVGWPTITRATFREREGAPLPADAATRIEEALWFVTSQPVRFSVMSSSCVDTGSRVTIQAMHSSLPARWFRPPLNAADPHTWNHCETLFFDCLDHVTASGAASRHPTSVWLWRIYESASRSAEDLALALSIAIEALLRRAFSDYLRPSDGVIEGLVELAEHIRTWGGPDSIRKRAERAVHHWKRENPRDGLRNLVESKVINEKHRAAWERLRHTEVHASREQAADKRDLLEGILELHQLWTMLAAKAFGYHGSLTDWTKAGWPLVAIDDLGSGSASGHP